MGGEGLGFCGPFAEPELLFQVLNVSIPNFQTKFSKLPLKLAEFFA